MCQASLKWLCSVPLDAITYMLKHMSNCPSFLNNLKLNNQEGFSRETLVTTQQNLSFPSIRCGMLHSKIHGRFGDSEMDHR